MGKLKEILARADGMKLAVLAVFAGLCLLLLPSQSDRRDTAELSEQAQMQQLLSEMQGVGDVRLMLSELGAVIVCEGADDAAVRLDICRAVQCYTGLGADRVRVFMLKSN